MTTKPSRPMKTRCIDALTEFLSTKKGTLADISKATGFGVSTIETHLRRLRVERSPLVRNVVDGRGRPSIVRDAVQKHLKANICSLTELCEALGMARSSASSAIGQLRVMGDPCIQNLRRQVTDGPLTTLGPAQTIEAAMSSRHPLETVWAPVQEAA